MSGLIFYDEGHRYTVDGEEVPSVSEITRFIYREVYSTVMQSAVDAAAERGAKIHKAAEALDKFGSVQIDDDIVAYVKAYVAFLKDYSPKWERIEWSVNNGIIYAGTIDRYGLIGNENILLDIKSTANISPAHRTLYTAAQNLYRMAIEPSCPVDRIYILQLKKDGSYKLYELEKQDSLANACIALHYALKKKKRKRKGDSENDQLR